MSQLAYPVGRPIGRATSLGVPLQLGEIEKTIPHPPYPINCYQVHLCEHLFGHLKLKDYIPIPRYLRIGEKRFSAPGVACDVLAWMHPKRFSWRRDSRRGLYNFQVSDERRRVKVWTWIGCYYGIRPEGMERLWEMNNSGLMTLPEIGDEFRKMMTDSRYFALDPEDEWEEREPPIVTVTQSPGLDKP